MDKLREDIAITEAQLTAQLEETKAAKDALLEACMEIEVGTSVFVFMDVPSYLAAGLIGRGGVRGFGGVAHGISLLNIALKCSVFLICHCKSNLTDKNVIC